jgi:hypothetical protein
LALTQDQNAAPMTAPQTLERPRYEPPRIQAMTERQILNTFQITQSMATWWTTACC